MTERVAIFIDGSNLYNGMRDNLSNTRVNLQVLVKQLLNKRPIRIVPKIEPDEAFFQGSATKAAATNALMIVLPLLGALALYLWYRQRNQKNRS